MLNYFKRWRGVWEKRIRCQNFQKGVYERLMNVSSCKVRRRVGKCCIKKWREQVKGNCWVPESEN